MCEDVGLGKRERRDREGEIERGECVLVKGDSTCVGKEYDMVCCVWPNLKFFQCGFTALNSCSNSAVIACIALLRGGEESAH